MPRLLPQQYAKVLYGLLKGLPEEKHDAALLAYIHFLKKEQVLSKAAYIMEAFLAYGKEQEGVREIELTSAQPISKTVAAEIAKKFDATLKSEVVIDKTLLGGMRAKIGNTIVDGSVRTQLLQLKNKFIA